jgi:hypothetical protein
MPRQQLYEYRKEGLVTYWRDAARTGIMFAQAHGGRAAGADICVERGWGAWSDLKARSDLLAIPGAEVFVWDIGQAGVYLVSDGANWRPRDGRQLLYQRFGDTTAPLDSKPGAASMSFALPQTLVIPAGLIAPHSRLDVRAEVRRTTATATATLNLRLGTAGSTADNTLYTASLAATAGLTAQVNQSARFGSVATRYTSMNNTNQNAQGNNLVERSTNVNTAADMRVTFDMSAANTADTFTLLGYSVYLEG